MNKVMLVDDEENIHPVIQKLLETNGYAYCGARNTNEARLILEMENPDLILLDVMLPGENGFNFCNELRKSGNDLPIIFLSAKDDIVDKSVGFQAGGDDYVTKPFDSTELLLRIEANIRRHQGMDTTQLVRDRNDSVVIGDLTVHFDEYEVTINGKSANLTTKEFEIVALLSAHLGKVFTRREIQEYLWGKSDVKDTNTITVFVRKIRKKIEKNPSEPEYLVTVKRVGYKIIDPTKSR